MSTNHTDAKTRHTLRWTAALLAAAGLAAGCSSSNDASVTSTSTAADASSTTAKSTGSTAKTSGTTAKTDGSGGSQDDVDLWCARRRTAATTSATSSPTTAPPMAPSTRSGARTPHTDDSSICTAAVHMGLITFEDGGEVTIVIEDGLNEYIGLESNDVTSNSYGSGRELQLP
ncbi:MAG: LCCL domain-containing protein [Acidimicrobiales bacterium]